VTDREQDTSQLSILEIFRLEVEQQAAIIYKGLSELQADSQASANPQTVQKIGSIESAVRTLHGASQIVEIDAAIELTDIMKTCLSAAENCSIFLSSDLIEVLWNGVNILVQMALEENLDRWLLDNSSDIQDTQNRILTCLDNAEALVEEQPTSIAHPETVESNTEPDTEPDTVISNASTSESSTVESPTVESSTSDISIESTERDDRPTTAEPVAGLVSDLSLKDSSMLDLFRLEVETQIEILNENLLILENNPQSPSALESLMRSAHSIKGAARIISIDVAVELAHAMEDCFVAAQKQSITLDRDRMDILFRGVDLLHEIARASETEFERGLSERQDEIQVICRGITALVQNLPDVEPLALQTIPPQTGVTAPTKSQSSDLVKTPPPTSDAIETPFSPHTAAKDRFVRVSAENLNRIMGLAGESLIEANWLQPFADSLFRLKKRQALLFNTLEKLQETLSETPHDRGEFVHLYNARKYAGECSQMLTDRLNELELFARRSANLSDRLYREVIASHMRPFIDGVQGFPRMIRDLARNLKKNVKLEIIGKSTSVDRDILKKLEAPLTHILRNAVDHGIESPQERLEAGKTQEGTIRLEAFHRGGMLSITVSDDGKGLNLDRLREKIVRKQLASQEMVDRMTEDELLEFLFLPGFSTTSQVTEISGRGVGLDVAKSMVQNVGGNLKAVSYPGKGMSFHFQLPLTLSVIRTLLVEVSGETYAFPLARIDKIVMVPKEEILVVENRQYFTLDGENIGLVAASQVLDLKDLPPNATNLPVVVISDRLNRYGLAVDRFLEERDLVVRPLDPRLGKVQDINAAAIREDGSLVLIVDVADLVRSIDKILATRSLSHVSRDGDSTVTIQQKQILVVDDSITVREMERKLLENHGYKVDVAVNGMDGWNAVRTNPYDLVIADIDMPRMNGIELVRRIKSHEKLKSIPVIIVSYKDRPEDRIQGLEAGANYYLTKGSFHDDSLVNAVIDLLGS